MTVVGESRSPAERRGKRMCVIRCCGKTVKYHRGADGNKVFLSEPLHIIVDILLLMSLSRSKVVLSWYFAE